MTAVPFDTAKYVDDLEAANMPREQARVVVDLMRSSHEAADVATKEDVSKLDTKIELLRKDMEGMRKDIIIWLGGLLIAGFGLVVGLMLKMGS